MKKLFYVLPGLCLFASGAAAEAIDSVSFNPARLGRYETLKVSDQLTTKGGIEANAVTVQVKPGRTVSVNNTGNYKFPVTEVLGSVDMKSTDFKAVTLNSRGTASFENTSSSAESKISTLNTSTADVRANILDLTNVTVPDEDENSLRLGENDIPRPASVGLDNCSNLTWVERTTDDNYKYKVLAFGSCKGGETNIEQGCDPEEEDCCNSDSDYFESHKQECCENGSVSYNKCYSIDFKVEVTWLWNAPNYTGSMSSGMVYKSTGTSKSKCDSYTAQDCVYNGSGVICSDTYSNAYLKEQHDWICEVYPIW